MVMIAAVVGLRLFRFGGVADFAPGAPLLLNGRLLFLPLRHRDSLQKWNGSES
jgi:hypothetical protein